MALTFGIRQRLMASHLFAAVLLAGAFGAFVYWMAQGQLQQRAQVQLAGYVKLIAGSLDSDRIAEAEYDSQVRRELVARLQSLTQDNAGISHVRIARHAVAGEHTVASSSGSPLVSEDSDQITARAPIAGSRNYFVVAQLGGAETSQELSVLRVRAMIAFLVCVLAALFIGRHLAGRILARITDLARRCRALASGEPLPPRHSGAHDELENLISEFDDMARRLRRTAEQREEALDSLREANEKLESRVLDRTSELEGANAKLKQEIEGRVHVEALLAEAALTDPLTGLLNRRAMMEMIDQASAQLQPGQPGLGLIVADIDHFKQINDNHGHRVGDNVLVAIARRMIELAGEANQRNVARWGGEEFLILLPDTRLALACRFAEIIRRGVSDLQTGIPNLRVSLSVGVAEFDAGDSLDDCLWRCDQAMYRAKEAGRNSVVAAQGKLFATMS